MKKIIDMYGEQYLDDILRDYNKLSKIYDNSINKKNSELPDSDDRNISRALELYFYKLILSSDMKNDVRLENYKKVLNMAMKKDPTYVFESKILDLPKQRLSNVMSDDVYNQFASYKEKVSNHCINIYNSLQNGKDVPEKDKQFLLKFLTSNIGTKDEKIYEMQENTIRRIINSDSKCDYFDANFFVSFIANEESKKYGYEVVSNVSKFPPANKTARGYASKYKVNISSEFAIKSLNEKGEDLANLLHTICHEVRHTKQNDDILSVVKNKNTINILTDKIFRENLSTKEFDFYHENYYFESGEKDAEIVGFSNADIYIYKYMNDVNEKEKLHNYLLDEKDHQIYIELIEMRKDFSQNKLNADAFRIKKLEEVLQRDNSYLEKFSQLKEIYDSNGNLKSFQDRLIGYADFKAVNKEDSKDIFQASFNYSLDNGELENIDFSKMSRADLYKVMHSLSELYNEYSHQSHNLLSSTREKDQFLNRERDIREATTYRDKSISLMASRYKKLESVLDVFYDKLGDDYGKQEQYKHDQFIYNKDKEYARYKFGKIKDERSKTELNSMLHELNNGDKSRVNNNNNVKQ